MLCVNMSVTPDEEALWKYRHAFCIDEKRTSPSHSHMLFGDTMTGNNQQADGFEHPLAVRDVLEALQYPPQVDTSACKDVKRKTRAGTVGMWGWWTCSSLTIHGPLSNPLLEKIIIRSSLDLAAYFKGDDIFLKLFYWVTRYYHNWYSFACFSTDPTCSDLLAFEYMFLLLYPGTKDIQTYRHPVGRLRRDARGMAYRLFFVYLFISTSEGDQKKDRKPPKPAPPTKSKTRKQKSGREGDKEKQEENEPRTEGSVY